jgi:uncharacterized protein (TIGR02246 family)
VTNATAGSSGADAEVRELYRKLLEAWDKRNARDYAMLFTTDAILVGFDGTQVFGQTDIGAHISEVFSHHQTARYVSIVRGVRAVTEDVMALSAVAGMVPPDKTDINPEVNAVQSMVAARRENAWQVALFQNTPAAFHGRPDDAKGLTEELRATLKQSITTQTKGPAS